MLDVWTDLQQITRNGSDMHKDSFPGEFQEEDIRCDVDGNLWPNASVVDEQCCISLCSEYV